MRRWRKDSDKRQREEKRRQEVEETVKIETGENRYGDLKEKDEEKKRNMRRKEEEKQK